MPPDILTIGDLAKSTDTKVETIRYYERIGILPIPARTTGNYRAYGSDQLARLSFIRRARDLGFSLEQVRQLLSLSDQRDRSCAAVDEIAREHLAEVDRKITDLNALRFAVNSARSLISAAVAQSPNAASSMLCHQLLLHCRRDTSEAAPA